MILATITVISLLLCLESTAQTTQVFEEWVKETAEQGLHQQGFTAIDAASNVYLTGSTLNSSGNYDILLTKTDRRGNELWSISFDGPGGGDDAATNVFLDNAGFVYVCGTVFVSATEGNNYFLVKLDSSGNEIWRFNYDNNGNQDVAADLVVDDSGLIYITGGSYNPTTQLSDFWTIKVSTQGSLLWSNVHDHSEMIDFGVKIRLSGSRVIVSGVAQTAVNQFAVKTLSHNVLNGNLTGTHLGAASTSQISEVRDVLIDAAENIYIVGSSMSQTNGRDAYLIKLSDNLDLLWQVTYDGNGLDDQFNGVSVTSSGALYVCGEAGTDTGSSDGLVVRYDGTGSLVWQHTEAHTTEARNSFNAIVVDASGNCFATGSASTLGGETVRTLCLSDTGSVLWRANYHSPQHNKRALGRTILLTQNGDVIVSGQIETTPDKFTYITLKYSERLLFLDSTLPLSSANGRGFAKNYGQIKTGSGAAADHVKYSSIDGQALLFFSEQAIHAVYSTNHQDSLVNDTIVKLDLQFVNPDRDLALLATKEEKLYYNYYIGESERYERVKNFESLHYFGVWRGIDLVYPNSASGEMCFFIDQNGNPAEIVFRSQADSMEVDSNGTLRLYHPLGTYHLPPLTAYERLTNGFSETLWQPTWSVLTDSTFSITGVGSYSTINGPLAMVSGLTIPCTEEEVPQAELLEYGSYMASIADDRVNDVVCTAIGCYVGGWTGNLLKTLDEDPVSENYEIVGNIDWTFGIGYVTKFSLNDEIEWVTYICVNEQGSGQVYLRALDHRRVGTSEVYEVISACGSIDGTPFTQGPQVNNAAPGSTRAFVLELLADSGFLDWLTTLDSSTQDYAYDVRATPNSNLVVVGRTTNLNTDFPIAQGPGASHNTGVGTHSAFIAEFNMARTLVWSTLFNGSNHDEAHCLDINTANHIVVAGTTTSPDLYSQPAPGTYQNMTLNGTKNWFIVEFGPQRQYLWSTLYNGEVAGEEYHKTIAWVEDSKIAFGGSCRAVSDIDFVNPGSGYFLDQGISTSSQSKIPFLSLFNSSRQPIWCTLLDGRSTASFFNLTTVKAKDNLLLCGYTTNNSNPLLQEIPGLFYRDEIEGSADACLTAFNSVNYALLYSTVFGGEEVQIKTITGIDFTTENDIFISGNTQARYRCLNGNISVFGIPVKNSNGFFQHNFNDLGLFLPNRAAWVYRLNFNEVIAVSSQSHQDLEFSVIVYPNPCQDLLNISSTEPMRMIQVFNANGQIVKETQIMNSRLHQLEMSDLPTGMYYARILTDQKHIVKPFIRMQ